MKKKKKKLWPAPIHAALRGRNLGWEQVLASAGDVVASLATYQSDKNHWTNRDPQYAHDSHLY
jgi:hypothetical protein